MRLLEDICTAIDQKIEDNLSSDESIDSDNKKPVISNSDIENILRESDIQNDEEKHTYFSFAVKYANLKKNYLVKTMETQLLFRKDNIDERYSKGKKMIALSMASGAVSTLIGYMSDVPNDRLGISFAIGYIGAFIISYFVETIKKDPTNTALKIFEQEYQRNKNKLMEEFSTYLKPNLKILK